MNKLSRERIEHIRRNVPELLAEIAARCSADASGATAELCALCDMALSSLNAEPVAHSDDIAVDKFATAMKKKLAKKREEGRGGWDDPEQCSIDYLARLFYDHVQKGDPVDIGNFAMMLWNRISTTSLPKKYQRIPCPAPPDLLAELAAAQERIKALEGDAERYRWLRTHFRFANDSVREIWFDENIDLAGAYGAHEPSELDAAIDTARNTEGRAG